MYCEEANVSETTAVPLMYAAKKYLLIDLVDQCQQYLQENLTVENVCSILELSQVFDELELQSCCLEFICQHTLNVIKTDGFLQLSRNALEDITRMDVLSVNEAQLYEACIGWAQHQLRTVSHIELPPKDTQMRDVLGNVLYRIRFPTMDQVEFTRLVGRSDVLSDQEKLSLYYYFNTREDKDRLVFDSNQRQMHELVVCRFASVSSVEWPTNGKTDAIDFTTDKDITLLAVGLYGAVNCNTHDVAIEVWTSKILLCIVSKKFESPSVPAPVKVYLGQKVKIKAGLTNTIVTTIKGPSTRYGCGGKSKFVIGGVSFLFTPSSKCAGRSGVESGQIPQLYFNAS